MAADEYRPSTLDPDDWAAHRATSHAVLDELLEYLRTVRERPVWRVPPPEVKARLQAPAPAGPQPIADLWNARDLVLPYLPVGPDFAIDVSALREAIAADRAAGLRPFCIVGTAGTVNTGAMDDLAALADVAAEERVWFHVDGAFGALAALSERLRPLVRGIERADSLAFDFHKWLHVPYAVGCLLVRDEELHRATFTTHESYLANRQRGIAGGRRGSATTAPSCRAASSR